MHKILEGNCLDQLKNIKEDIELTFLDPPFNQDKDYALHNDKMDDKKYWEWMTSVCASINASTINGGSIYFMQREKNEEFVFKMS